MLAKKIFSVRCTLNRQHLTRLKALRLTTSHAYLHQKLDEFGKDHKKSICHAVVHQGQYIANNRCLDGAEQPQCPQVNLADSG